MKLIKSLAELEIEINNDRKVEYGSRASDNLEWTPISVVKVKQLALRSLILAMNDNRLRVPARNITLHEYYRGDDKNDLFWVQEDFGVPTDGTATGRKIIDGVITCE